MQLGYNWVFFPRWGNADRTVYLAGNKEKEKVPKLGFVFLWLHYTSMFGSSSIKLFIFAQIPSEHTMKKTSMARFDFLLKIKLLTLHIMFKSKPMDNAGCIPTCYTKTKKSHYGLK